MSAAFCPDQRMDLVNDHRIDRAQDLAGLRSQHQIQRLGRRDQDLRRMAPQPRPIFRRRITRPDGDRGLMVNSTIAIGGRPHPGQRRTEISLDIDPQGFQRRNVQHPHARVATCGGRFRIDPARRGPPGKHDAVDGDQERRQRLSRAGRSQQQRVMTAGDHGPSQNLSRCRRVERVQKPAPQRRVKRCQGVLGDVFLGIRHHQLDS
jgi:hypothetical protein